MTDADPPDPPTDDAAAGDPPAGADPAAPDPLADEPAPNRPVSIEPVTGHPEPDQPATEGPEAEQPPAQPHTTANPAADNPPAPPHTADRAAAEQPTTDKSATDETAADKTAADKTAAEQPTTDKSATDETAADKTAADKTAAEQPTTDKSATDKSAADTPAAIQHDGKEPAVAARARRRRSRKRRARARRAATHQRPVSPAVPEVPAEPAPGQPASDTPADAEDELTVSAEAAAAQAARRDRAFPVGRLRLLLESLPLAVFAVLFASWLYRVGDASLRMTPLYQERSDARLIASMIKTIHTDGWYLTNPLLGAPFGQQLYDFPHGGENLQLGLIRLLSGLTDGYAHTMNLYFLGGFGLLAVVTLLVLRHLRFSYPVAALIAVIYTFLPYHFFHEQAHLYRSTYFSAPLACLLLIWALSPGVAFRRPPENVAERGSIRWGRVAVAVALGAVVATTETMTTAFTMTLLASGGLVLAIRHRRPGRLIAPALMVLGIAAVFLASNYPTLNYYAEEGTNDRAARREIVEQELYGLKLSRLVLPPGNHRSEALGDLGARAGRGTAIRSEGGQYLGIVGVAGFLGALYGAFARGVGRRADPWRPLHDRRHLLERSSLLVVLAVLFGTISGFAIVLGLAGFSQVRVWNRILILIAFFSLLWVATWFERLVGVVRRRWSRVVALPLLGVLGAGVAAFTLWDGAVPADRDYDRLDAQVRSDRAFVADIEAVLPDGAAVFQLPVIAFPETPPPGDMLDYDHLRGFLADEDGSLRWSYGAIKGRPEADWQRPVGTEVSVVGSLPALVGMGFEGLWFDTFGYDEDTGEELASDIEAATASEPVVSPDGRFLFFDLARFIRELDRTPEQLTDEAERVLDVRPPGSDQRPSR